MSLAFAIREKDSPIVWRGPMKTAAIRQFLAQAQWGARLTSHIDSPGTGDEQPDDLPDDHELTGTIIVTTPRRWRSSMPGRCLLLPLHGCGDPRHVENMSGLFCPHCNTEIRSSHRGRGDDGDPNGRPSRPRPDGGPPHGGRRMQAKLFGLRPNSHVSQAILAIAERIDTGRRSPTKGDA